MSARHRDDIVMLMHALLDKADDLPEEARIRALSVLSEHDGVLRSEMAQLGDEEGVVRLDSGIQVAPDAALTGVGAVPLTQGRRQGSASTPPAAAPVRLLGRERLAEWLENLIVSILRAGVDSASASPTVRALLRPDPEEEPLPASLILARWAGRLRRALQAHDALMVLLLLEGGRLAAAALKESETNPLAELWLGKWVLQGRNEERYYGRALVELGRERVDGWNRGALERRHLVDPATAEVFCEWARHQETGLSVGPCPRLVTVALASAQRLPGPTWLHLHQYSVSPFIESVTFEALAAQAHRRVDTILDAYFEGQRRAPGISEPFVVFAPEPGSSSPLTPVGTDNRTLPLIGSSALWAEALEKLWSHEAPRLLAGRIVLRLGRMYLAPCSALFGASDKLTFSRLS